MILRCEKLNFTRFALFFLPNFGEGIVFEDAGIRIQVN